MNLKLACSLSIAVALLAGCAAAPPRSSPAPVIRSGQQPSAVEPEAAPGARTEDDASVGVYAYRDSRPEPARPAQNSAVVALLSSANRQQQTGDLSGAVATLERALRIEPRNPGLWHQLASLRMQQGSFSMAVDLAAKSNTLAGMDRDLQRDNWALISRARKAMGDSAGAREAEAKMREF